MKYLVTYKTNCGVSSKIHETEDEMTINDILKFQNIMSSHTNTCEVLTFNKLADEKPAPNETTASKDSNKFAVFVLYDTEYKECVLVYTYIDDIISYTFERGKMIVALKENDKPIKKYICGIPGIWLGDENVMETVPKGIRNELGEPVLYSHEYDGYETVK